MNPFNTPFDEGENVADKIVANTAETNADESADKNSARSAHKKPATGADKEVVDEDPLHELHVPSKWSH